MGSSQESTMLSKTLQLFIVPVESSTMLADNDGTCNSMPGWNPLSIWNPVTTTRTPTAASTPCTSSAAWAWVLPMVASTQSYGSASIPCRKCRLMRRVPGGVGSRGQRGVLAGETTESQEKFGLGFIHLE